MGYIYNKSVIILFIIIILLVSVLIIIGVKSHDQREAELDLYVKYIRKLTPEEIIREYFINMSNKDTDKMILMETDHLKVLNNGADHSWKYNLKYIKLLDVKFSMEITEMYTDEYAKREKSYIDIKGYKISCELNQRKEMTQSNGEHEWVCCLVKESEESGWLIFNYGFY